MICLLSGLGTSGRRMKAIGKENRMSFQAKPPDLLHSSTGKYSKASETRPKGSSQASLLGQVQPPHIQLMGRLEDRGQLLTFTQHLPWTKTRCEVLHRHISHAHKSTLFVIILQHFRKENVDLEKLSNFHKNNKTSRSLSLDLNIGYTPKL